MASPSELATELNAPLGNVSYHVRILASLGLIRLVKETPRRGSVEHHYEAVARPVISDAAWASVPETVKRAMVGAALEQAGLYVNAAAAGGGFDRPEAHLSRTPLALDAEGWGEVADELRGFMERIEGIARDAEGRLARAAEPGDAAMFLMMLFGSSGLDEDESTLLEEAPDPEHRGENGRGQAP